MGEEQKYEESNFEKVMKKLDSMDGRLQKVEVWIDKTNAEEIEFTEKEKIAKEHGDFL